MGVSKAKKMAGRNVAFSKRCMVLVVGKARVYFSNNVGVLQTRTQKFTLRV